MKQYSPLLPRQIQDPYLPNINSKFVENELFNSYYDEIPSINVE